MNDKVERHFQADASDDPRKPWIRPTLQLLSANSAEASTGSAGDISPCPGSDADKKKTCS